MPIFNPIKNDGKTDTFLAGELDEFGGHCGRADDYHYHIAPMHLQKYVGAGRPIAYALDGFPIYGLFDPAAKSGGPDADKCCPLGSHEPLDELNGHFGATTKGPGPDGTGTVAVPGLYHYHASVKYPYLNGGMRGVVTVKDDQIDPQPRATSPRSALPPLRGASITGFKATGRNDEPSWSLEYLLNAKKHLVNYRLENGQWIFDFVDPTDATKTETYDASSPPRRQGGGGGGGGGGRRGEGGGGRRPRDDGPAGGNRPPPPPDAAPREAPEPAPKSAAASIALTSADVTNGRLAIDCTCDSKATPRAPTLSWGKPPEGTKAFAVVMHHITRDSDTHVYMVVTN
ncbi:MAG: YHYH protein, partial [Phycisphaerales bacterium]|nr:YHYH protein [Phycisphaerales bacterium]